MVFVIDYRKLNFRNPICLQNKKDFIGLLKQYLVVEAGHVPHKP